MANLPSLHPAPYGGEDSRQKWYRWVCELGTGEKGEVGFMVNQAPSLPAFGAAPPAEA